MPRYTRTDCCDGGQLAMTRRNPSPQYRYEHYDPRG